jgi:thymidine phosphorylase
MSFAFPWMNHEIKASENVGLISLGAIDEKIPLILHTLLPSVDIALGCYQNYHFPPLHMEALFDEIKSFIQNIEGKAIVFDLRVQDWPDFQRLRQSRELGHSLQHICSLRHISSSVILSSGSQQPGNLMGIPFEVLEARDVLGGKGPADLSKFALEIGSDFLLLTKKVRHKMEAHILLKEKILSGEASSLAEAILDTSFSSLVAHTKKRVYSPERGYLHHWNPKVLLTIRNRLSTSFPGSGFALLKSQGEKLKKGDPIAETFLLEGHKKYDVDNDLKGACTISAKPPDFRPFVLERFEMKFS